MTEMVYINNKDTEIGTHCSHSRWLAKWMGGWSEGWVTELYNEMAEEDNEKGNHSDKLKKLRGL
jgi:hypothetical protein